MARQETGKGPGLDGMVALDERERELAARAAEFQAEIGMRLASGPAMPMDFDRLKSCIRRERTICNGERS